MHSEHNPNKPLALSLLSSERPRNVSWTQAAGLLFGDWGTSRLYVLGIAFAFAGGASFWLILMMSVLVVGVGWGYTQICRIYADGGGVYTAAKHKSQLLAVIGALLLFADYVVTASLSGLDSFHYFGLPLKSQTVQVHQKLSADVVIPPALNVTFDKEQHLLQSAGRVSEETEMELLKLLPNDRAWREGVENLVSRSRGTTLFAWDSPGLWALVMVIVIGAFNLLGPKHTGAFALMAAGGMALITLLITVFALPQVSWKNVMPKLTHFDLGPKDMWLHFVGIVLALSGVEAIGNLTGVMKKPVAKTARKAIWVVAAEVAIFNILLALCMISALSDGQREDHKEDMLAFLSSHFINGYAELGVRVVGGILLLSAVNTVITDMISVQYLMSRDGELPLFFQRLNKFGVPWVPAVIATVVPCLVLIISHDLDSLAALYAIGVVGAVAINITLVSTHPRLRATWRKALAIGIGVLLLAIWVTLACTKLHALVFVAVVLTIGLIARAATKAYAKRNPKPSLLQQAVSEILTADAMSRPKLLLGTYGSDKLASAAIETAREAGATLVVCFIRQVSLSYKYEAEKCPTIETDLAALKTFAKFLDLGHDAGVPVLPVYDMGQDAAVLMAETAALYGCHQVLIGTSRRGAIFHLIKGTFQRQLEAILPPDVNVKVISPLEHPDPPRAVPMAA